MLACCAALLLVASAARAETGPVTGSKVYRQLKKDVDQIRLIDTHEHLSNEDAYAHAEMAREVVTAALAEKVLSGYLAAADARELAVKFLRNNAIDLYRLKLPKASPPGTVSEAVGER